MPKRLRPLYFEETGSKLQLASELMRDFKLPEEEVTALTKALQDKRLSPLVRNNIANSLIAQDKPCRDLHRVFLAIVEDPQESPTWRDYALQFLAETIAFSSEPELVERKLREVAAGSDAGDMQGTAIVHLARLERAGHVQLGPEFDNSLASAVENPAVSGPTKISVMATLGARRARQHAALVRQYARQNRHAGLKRTAIASLGLLGDPADMALIRPALDHSNPAVVKAAEAALRRLEQAAEGDAGDQPPPAATPSPTGSGQEPSF